MLGSLRKTLHKLDFFGTPIPSFNLNGKSNINTALGGCLSLSILYITFQYSMIKLLHLFKRHNPLINTYEESNALAGEYFYPSDEGFVIAVGLEEYTTKEPKNDPRYVKWIANYIVYEDSKISEFRTVAMNVCSDEDYEKFTATEVRSDQKVSKLRA